MKAKVLIVALLILGVILSMIACGGKQDKCDMCGKAATRFDAELNGKKMKLCSECLEKIVSDQVDELAGSETADDAEQESGPSGASGGEVKELAVDEHLELSVDGYKATDFEWEVIADTPDDPETLFSISVNVDEEKAVAIGYNPGIATIQATHKESGEEYCFDFRVVGGPSDQK